MTDTATTPVSAPARPHYSRARAAHAIALAGAGIAAALYFAVLPVAKFGIFNRLEIVVIAFFAAGALCAAGVAFAGVRARSRAIRAPLVLPLLALGLWSLAFAPATEFPWRSLLGPPQTGQGILALFAWAAIAAAIAASAGPRARAILAWLVAAGAVAAALTHFLPEPWRPFEVPGYFAWLGIAAFGALAALGTRLAFRVGLVVLLLSLAVSENRSAIVIVLGLGVPLYFAARACGTAVWLRPVGTVLTVILVPLATAAVWLAGHAGLGVSIEARARINDVMVAAFADRKLTLLFGHGWGGSVEALFRHLPSGTDRLYGDSWDVPIRDFHSAHNLALEFWVSAGFPGLLLALALPALVVARARSRDLPLAIALAAVFATLSVLWHQQSFNLGPTIVALCALARKPWNTYVSARAGRAMIGGGIAVSAACFGSAIWLAQYGWRAHVARLDPGVCMEGFPADAGRGDLGLRYSIYGYTAPVLVGHRPPEPARTAALVCAVDRALAERPSVHLAIAAVIYRSEAFAVPVLRPDGVAFDQLAADWPAAIETLLALAPRRTDLAIPYFSYLASRSSWTEMAAHADSIRRRDPTDPVGLWFSGLALFRSESPEARLAGRARLRAALEHGLLRVLPLPEETVNQLK
jgi:hypothetical protein